MKPTLIFVCHGSMGDVIPLLAYAKYLDSQGFDTLLLSYSVFKGLADKAGIAFIGLGDKQQYQSMVSLSHGLNSDDYALHHYQSCARYAVKQSYTLLKQLFAKHHKPIVFSLSYCVGAKWACMDFDKPFVRVVLSPCELEPQQQSNAVHSNEQLRLLVEADAYALRGKHIDASSDSFSDVRSNGLGDGLSNGLSDDRRDNASSQSSEDAATCVCLFPKALAYKAPPLERDQIPFLGFMDKGALPLANQNHGRFDIVYTPGSAFAASNNELLSFKLLCAALKKKGLFISNNATIECDDNTGEAPACEKDWVLVVSSADISRSLTKTGVLIHHGGVGTMADAFKALVPQIIIPKAFDQHANGQLIEHFNLGRCISLDQFNDVEFMRSLVELLVRRQLSISNTIKREKLNVSRPSLIPAVARLALQHRKLKTSENSELSQL